MVNINNFFFLCVSVDDVVMSLYSPMNHHNVSESVSQCLCKISTFSFVLFPSLVAC